MRRWSLALLTLILFLPTTVAASQLILETGPGYFAQSLAWDGTTLWVEENGPRIHRHDPTTGQELWSIFPEQPNYFIANNIASDGHHLWGCSWPGLQIAEIDPVDGRVLRLHDLESSDGIAGAPAGLVWKDGALWMLTSGPASICRVDPATGAISQKVNLAISIFIYPAGLAWDGEDFWTADMAAGLLLRIDPKTGAAIDSVASPGDRPTGLTWDGHYLWVASERLYKIDVNAEPHERMRERRSYWWGYYGLHYDLEWDNGQLWESGDGFSLTDPASGQDVRTIAAPQSSGNTGIAFDGTHLWSAFRWFGGELYEVDPAFGKVLNRFAYDGHEPMGMAFDGSNLWIADLEDTALYVYSWPSAVFERKLRAPGPQAAGVTWDGQRLWESDRTTGLLSLLDPNTGTVNAQFRLPMALPLGIAANPRDTTMWVADGGSHHTVQLEFPPGPTHIYDWTATELDSSVVLKWLLTEGSTASGFFVERRSYSDSTYTPLGPAHCQGDSCGLVDGHPTLGSINYYRMKVTELDGSSKYVGPLSATFHFSYGAPVSIAEPGNLRAAIYPSPAFGGRVSISALGTPGATVTARLFDVRGRLVRTVSLSEGANGTFNGEWDERGADGRAVGAGVYLAAVDDGKGHPVTVRIVILR